MTPDGKQTGALSINLATINAIDGIAWMMTGLISSLVKCLPSLGPPLTPQDLAVLSAYSMHLLWKPFDTGYGPVIRLGEFSGLNPRSNRENPQY